jgi:hypothetical protein
MKYRSKPVKIDAVQYTGNLKHLKEWLYSLLGPGDWVLEEPTGLAVKTLQGHVQLTNKDWVIVPEARNEAYPCSPAVFTNRYEAWEV